MGAGAKIFAYYPTGMIWEPVQCDINGVLQVYDSKVNQLTTFGQETAGATNANGVNWVNLLDKSAGGASPITKFTKICGFTVTIAGGWAGKCLIRITDGAGNKIFPFQASYTQDTDFTSGTQLVFNFDVEVTVGTGYILQFSSTNAGDGAGNTCQLNNLDVIAVG